MVAKRQAGGSLVEVLIALAIFSTISAGLAQTLVVALRARRTSAYWMEATQLAVEWIERARAGQADQATETFGKFQRTIQIRPDAESLPLQRVDVTVEWEDDGPKQFVLSLLQRPRR